MICRKILAVLLVVCAAACAWGAEDESESVSLTVYNDGNAIVRETRAIEIPESREVSFPDVAATIDPTTVKFRSLTNPDGTTVIEQNYEFDLVSADKLLEKYINQTITVITEDGTVHTGTLMSYDRRELVLSMSARGPLLIISREENVKNIRCESLPEGLITRPTLMWILDCERVGKETVQVAYSAGGCSWEADYTAVLTDDDKALDLSGWVTLTNNTGKTYRDAALKLMAGEVHRVAPQPTLYKQERLAFAGAGEVGFEEKPFAEYHLYTLPRPTTIKDRQIKQIELIDPSLVKCRKKYLLDAARSVQIGRRGPVMDENFSVGEKVKVQVYILFTNDEESNLGKPLPAGRVRLFKMDEGQMEFVGEDRIEHTPVKGKVELLMGTAFDITAERKRTSFNRPPGMNRMEESFEITLLNSRKEPVTVHVRERLYRWTGWEIVEASHKFDQLDAETVGFEVNLEAEEEKRVTYTVRYEW